MRIKDLPWFNRPGFKLTRNGVSSLDNAELLAIIFGVGSKGESALELSNRLLKKYNLNKLEELSVKDLAKECNWNYNKALQILSLIELSKRYNKLISGGYKYKIITKAEDVYNMFKDELRNYKKEVLKAVLLDTKNKVISVKEISVGTLNSSLIHPREVFKEAIKESAYSIILVHNHPSGDPKPSDDDIKVTKQMIQAGKNLDIPLVDHIIIGKNKFWNWLDNQN